ncbi:MAG: aminotransferase class I/II-fold pyridoxal phosphate-dependent enzyme [Actinomycetes bacterium]
MGFIDRYRKFAEIPDEEVKAGFKAKADERRKQDLERVEVLDLVATTPEELPHPAVAAAISFAGKRGINQAGDPIVGELRDRIASLSRVAPDQLALGSGATGVIGAIAASILKPGDSLLTPWPSYPLYPLAAAAAGADAIPLGPDREPERIAEAVAKNPSARILMLCNPNDPNGVLSSPDSIAKLRALLPDRVVLVVDEALADYSGEDHMRETAALASRSSGILLVRTMSKAWGLAGLRVGWAIGGDDEVELLSRLAPVLAVSDPSAAGALAALHEAPDTPVKRCAAVRRERQRLSAALKGTPVELSDSQANLAWIRIPGMDGASLAAHLRGSGLLVKDGAEVGADAWVRATVRGDGSATDRLAEGLVAASASADAQARSSAD